MRPGHWLPFGTLVLLLAGCSSRGGESLFSGEAPPIDFDEKDAALDDDAPGEDEADAGDDALPDADADGESDAGDDASDGAIDEEEAGSGDLPPATIACGDATCTTPDEYCCRPPRNVVGSGIAPACKLSDEPCRLGPANLVSGTRQECDEHSDCPTGGHCCASVTRSFGNQSIQDAKCKAYCEGDDELEVCNPQAPQCTTGSCQESSARGLYVCTT